MTRQRFVVLLVLALLVVAGAVWLSQQRELRRDDGAGTRVLPDLAKALNDVSEVRLVKAGEQSAVTLKRADANWLVAERAGYPADRSKVGKLLIDLSELKVVEQKTANPANYAVLGVEDLKAPGATGVRVDLAGLPQPAGLIVGKSAGSRSSYARLAQSEQSLAIAPALTLDTEPRNWLDRALLDIPAARVQEVRITDESARSYVVRRESHEQTDFTVSGLPKGRKLIGPTAANPVATALAGFTFDDVRSTASPPASSKGTVRAEFRLFDGTIIDITGMKEGDHRWIQLRTRYDEAQQQAFAVAAPPPASATPDAKAEPDAKAGRMRRPRRRQGRAGRQGRAASPTGYARAQGGRGARRGRAMGEPLFGLGLRDPGLQVREPLPAAR